MSKGAQAIAAEATGYTRASCELAAVMMERLLTRGRSTLP